MKNRAAVVSRQAERALKPHIDALVEHRESISRIGNATLWVTNNVGSVGFFLLVVVWTVAWFCWNIFAPRPLRFDNYPMFMGWALISNMIQLLLLPLILIGQKLESKEAHLRAEADFEVNKQAEKENHAILRQLEDQERLIAEMMALIKQMNEKDKLPEGMGEI